MHSQEPTLLPENQACYQVFKAHDARFDGRIYVGVRSTGIYCRPVCRVKMPKEENCTFHTSAAAAEAAGFRPCLRCRPELAPGNAPVDAASALARRAALLIDSDCLEERSLADLSESLGVSDRHLRRVFAREYGASPVQYLQTRRLLLAKSLLTDTRLPVTAIAFASGFGSIRRFNALFKEHYRLSPSDLRKSHPEYAPTDHDAITLYLGYRPPYDWGKILAFFEPRVIPGVEWVDGGCYRRTAVVGLGEDSPTGWLSVTDSPGKNALAATVSASLLPVLPQVLARLRNLFDLDSDPTEVFSRLKTMNDIRPDLCAPGTRVPGCFDPFEMAVRAILGQQITVKAARTLAGRMVEAFGPHIATPYPALARAFPTPEHICGLALPIEEHLGPLGIIRTRARSIRALAEAMRRGEISLSPTSDPEEEMKRLLSLPGFGQWTVHYLAMRALAYPDAFPHTDYGVKKALDNRDPKEILRLAEAWRPWRSYATVNLWNSL